MPPSLTLTVTLANPFIPGRGVSWSDATPPLHVTFTPDRGRIDRLSDVTAILRRDSGVSASVIWSGIVTDGVALENNTRSSNKPIEGRAPAEAVFPARILKSSNLTTEDFDVGPSIAIEKFAVRPACG